MTTVHNPFSTVAITPAAIPFLGDPARIDDAVRRWKNAGLIGQIVGRHGAGKTNFTYAMEAEVASHFTDSRRSVIRPHSKQMTAYLKFNLEIEGRKRTWRAGSSPLLILDGLERLSPLNRWLLLRHCRSRKTGLLATTHQKLTGLPVVATIEPELETLVRIVGHLLRDQPPEVQAVIDDAAIRNAYIDNQGDIRESLMTLYDAFESWSRGRNPAVRQRQTRWATPT